LCYDHSSNIDDLITTDSIDSWGAPRKKKMAYDEDDEFKKAQQA